ncbi:MAG: cation transporter [Chlamydiae bacterium]|nr:cation transporter [Chlamydiota bacterium]
MHDLRRKALLLSYLTVGYNLLEGIVSVLAGAAAGSVALVGFGLDSAVESLSGCVMIWRLRRAAAGGGEEEERVERKALRLIGATFFILAAYVLYESGASLLSGEAAGRTVLGVIIAAVSLVTMPALFWAKRRLGVKMGMGSLVADSKETLACAFLSAALLAGLGLNYLWGLWWADPAAGLVIAAFLVREGAEAVSG